MIPGRHLTTTVNNKKRTNLPKARVVFRYASSISINPLSRIDTAAPSPKSKKTQTCIHWPVRFVYSVPSEPSKCRSTPWKALLTLPSSPILSSVIKKVRLLNVHGSVLRSCCQHGVLDLQHQESSCTSGPEGHPMVRQVCHTPTENRLQDAESPVSKSREFVRPGIEHKAPSQSTLNSPENLPLKIDFPTLGSKTQITARVLS